MSSARRTELLSEDASDLSSTASSERSLSLFVRGWSLLGCCSRCGSRLRRGRPGWRRKWSLHCRPVGNSLLAAPWGFLSRWSRWRRSNHRGRRGRDRFHGWRIHSRAGCRSWWNWARFGDLRSGSVRRGCDGSGLRCSRGRRSCGWNGDGRSRSPPGFWYSWERTARRTLWCRSDNGALFVDSLRDCRAGSGWRLQLRAVEQCL